MPGFTAWFAIAPLAEAGRKAGGDGTSERPPLDGRPWVSDTSEDRPASAQIDAQAAADALETLPAEDREMIVMQLWGGLTFQQIGQLIGASDSAAHRRYTKAIEALKAALSENTQ